VLARFVPQCGINEATDTPLQKYPREIIADVLAANDIVDIIGAAVELKAAGPARFKARCPFHNERTPSFTVSRDRQQYHCFGCGKHGNTIGFLCEHEGLSFTEALRKLADRAGIRLPAATEADNREEFLRSQLIEFGKFAARFFQDALAEPLKGSQCRQYLKGRTLKPETVKQFAVGYAPDDFSLLDKAKEAGFRENVLEASGLARRGERGGLYSFFRNRLMVPIRDVSGNTVAFGGRVLGDGTPKYINSPENALYRKSRVLYGLYEAREAMKSEKYAILVEGYFDLLRCFDAGVCNVVAPCGTALTSEQAALIRRYVPEVVVTFDADAAGVRAALRGIGVLTNAGLTVRALTLPDGKDPDDYIGNHGAEAFRELIRHAQDVISFYVRMSAERTTTIEGRTEVAREIFQILTGLDDEMRRDAYLEATAHALRLDKYACAQEYRKYKAEQAGRVVFRAEPKVVAPVFNQDDLAFLAAVLSSEMLLLQAKKELEGIPLPVTALGEVLAVLFESNGPDAALRLESDAAQALYAAASTAPEQPAEKTVELVTARVISLRREALLGEEARLTREVRDAELDDPARARELLMEKLAILRQLERLAQSKVARYN